MDMDKPYFCLKGTVQQDESGLRWCQSIGLSERKRRRDIELFLPILSPVRGPLSGRGLGNRQNNYHVVHK